jgi:hypothetical protein
MIPFRRCGRERGLPGVSALPRQTYAVRPQGGPVAISGVEELMDYYEVRDKMELLSRYSGDYPRLRGILSNLDQAVIDFIPPIDDAWSIREHMAHLADVEVRAFIRYRSSIIDNGLELILGGGDVDKNNGPLRYSSQRVEDSLEIIRLLRRITMDHVSRMSDDEMEGYRIRHPDLGMISLKMILSIYTQHVDKHIEYLLRNIALFNEETKRVLGSMKPKGAGRGRKRSAGRV